MGIGDMWGYIGVYGGIGKGVYGYMWVYGGIWGIGKGVYGYMGYMEYIGV